MFRDRTDAGKKLGVALEKYRNRDDVIVLAIPRGGVEVGYQVAKHLNSQFSLLIARKLPFPDKPESGFGAIAEDGSSYTYPRTELWLPKDIIEEIKLRQKKEIERRIQVLRQGRQLPPLEGKTVILIDDGIAMGSTMRASIQMCQNKKTGKIVVAVPVTGKDRKEEIAQLVDEIVVLETPWNFRAVAQVYLNWYDVPDEEVIAIMKQWKEKRSGS